MHWYHGSPNVCWGSSRLGCRPPCRPEGRCRVHDTRCRRERERTRRESGARTGDGRRGVEPELHRPDLRKDSRRGESLSRSRRHGLLRGVPTAGQTGPRGRDVGIEGLVFGLAEAGVLTSAQIEALNTAVADGSLAGDDSLLNFAVEFDERPVPARVIAEALLATHGFHFGPAGVHVRPGDTVLFSAESPDHAVTVYHEGHGRQNRVPDGVGPISSPLVPVGGYWLFRFETTGVYDVYCPPHDPFGMNMRVVVSEGDTVPPLDVEQTGRPPTAENALPSILGGLDPNVPSSAEVLASDALDPAEIVAEGTVPWHRVVDEHRQG